MFEIAPSKSIFTLYSGCTLTSKLIKDTKHFHAELIFEWPFINGRSNVSYTVYTVGATECDICPAGYYCTERDKAIPCQLGHYCPTGTGDDLVMCPTGTFANVTGLAAEPQCSQCSGLWARLTNSEWDKSKVLNCRQLKKLKIVFLYFIFTRS